MDIKMTVLVVDDSGTMRMLFKKNLQQVGFENIILATDGQDATEKLELQRIDLVISDWNMPRMDGLDLVKWMRANDKYKAIPFIMATAQGDKTQQKIARDAGANNHIAKPFTAEQLKECIDEVFGMKKETEPTETRRFVNGKVVMKVAHIQITDHLLLGVLKHWIQTGKVTPKYFELDTLCNPGWNPIQQSLEKGDIDGAFVLAPIAMDLFGYGAPIKLVLLAHKNGSIFVRSSRHSEDDYASPKSLFKYKVVNIPHKMSIHNMLAHKYLSELGLRPGVPGKKAIDVRFEVVPPIQMPQIMKENDEVAGFIVAEPIGSNAIAKKIAVRQFLSHEIWPNHPCCIVTFRQEFIEQYPDAVHEFVALLVQAGKFIESHKDEAAAIAVNFLDPEKKIGLTIEVLGRVLNEPGGITLNDLSPIHEDFDTIQRYMHEKMEIGVLIDVEKFIDMRFSQNAHQL